MATTAPAFKPGQRIDIPSVPNLRDIGGYATAGGGRVRTGQLYRSTELNHLEGEDLDRFSQLGIRVVFDLRTEAERKAQPDVVPKGTEEVVCDVLKDAPSSGAAQVQEIMANPAKAEKLIGGDKALKWFDDTYRSIVSLPSALSAYHDYFDRIMKDTNRPGLFHCTTGKDRTGWAAASTLLLLGVSEKDVQFDYELTNRDLWPALKPVTEQFRAAGGDPDMLKPVLGVDARYLKAAMEEMHQKFGSLESYFSDGLGIDKEGQQHLRETLVDDHPQS